MPKNHRHVDAEVKKEQIERAAAELFMEQGYESTSMAAIARGAGIATNTIYWYYPSKDDLLLRCSISWWPKACNRWRPARIWHRWSE